MKRNQRWAAEHTGIDDCSRLDGLLDGLGHHQRPHPLSSTRELNSLQEQAWHIEARARKWRRRDYYLEDAVVGNGETLRLSRRGCFGGREWLGFLLISWQGPLPNITLCAPRSEEQTSEIPAL